MREASPRGYIERLMGESNYLGAYLYLKEAELEHEEYVELVGLVAGAVAEELSRTRRDDRERIFYLRSILAWILRDVPGLGSLYREQLRESRPRGGLLESVTRGFQNAGDVASGRKSVSDGFQDAAEDVRRGFEDAAESGEAGARVNDFLSSAEAGIRQGIDQLGEFFRAMNEQTNASRSHRESENEADPGVRSDAERAARADAEQDVEDVPFESEETEEKK